jgi:hypothetical protein
MIEPPNNRYKAPFLAVMAGIGLFSVVLGAIGGYWWSVALGALVFVISLVLLRLVRSGRNPRWLRAPLDPK